MAGTGLYANSSSQMGLAIETTRGTPAAAPTIFIPVKNPKIQPVLTTVDNDSLVGSAITLIDQIITKRHDEYTFTMFAYVDTLPAILRGLLGGTDAVSGTATPYTHTFSLLNNVADKQPPSYTFFDWDGYQLRTMAGGQVDEVQVKFTAMGLVEITVKVLTLPYTTSAVAPTAVFSTVEAAPAWDCAVSLNGTSNTSIVDGQLNFKRNVKPLEVLGSQAPKQLWANDLDMSGCTLTLLNQDDSEQNLALAGTAFPLTLKFSIPTSAGMSFEFQMSNVKASQTHQERGSDGVIITQLDLKAIGNSTDATSGGLSPVKFIAVNGQSTAY